MLTRRSFIATGVAAVFCGMDHGARAEAATILDVSGKLQRPDGQASRSYSLVDLDAFGLTTVTAHTPWYAQACRFEGVLLSRLMEDSGVHAGTLRVSAVNDYVADIPFSDLAYGVILASRRNGQIMPLTDKGPLFVIYPFDSIPALQHQSFFSRSVWQVNRIEVL